MDYLLNAKFSDGEKVVIAEVLNLIINGLPSKPKCEDEDLIF